MINWKLGCNTNRGHCKPNPTIEFIEFAKVPIVSDKFKSALVSIVTYINGVCCIVRCRL